MLQRLISIRKDKLYRMILPKNCIASPKLYLILAFVVLNLITPYWLISQNCSIDDISAGDPTCMGDHYNVDLTIDFNEFIPIMGTIQVEANDSTFLFPIVPNDTIQVVVITMPVDGQSVSISASVLEDQNCIFNQNDLFTAPEGCGKIGSLVWNDTNFDGIQNYGELGFPGIKISLLDCDGEILEETFTQGNGNYLFDFLLPGNYLVKAELPSDGGFYEWSPYKTIENDTLDNDFDNSGLSICIELEEGSTNLNIDAGIISCPPLTGLVCDNKINVTLDENCENVIFPEMIVEGNVPCFSALEVRLFDDSGFIGNTVTVNQIGKTVTAVVIDQQSDVFCTSEIEVFDLRKPTLECEPDPIEKASIPKNIQFIPGDLTNGPQQYFLEDFSCWYFNQVPNTTDPYFYGKTSIQVDQSDIYELVLFTDWGDGAGAIIDTEFDVTNPCQHILTSTLSASNDLGLDVFSGVNGDLSTLIPPGMEPMLNLVLQLQQGRSYDLITSSYAPEMEGNYVWVVFSANGGRLLNSGNGAGFSSLAGNVEFDLLCTDEDSLLNRETSLDILGIPIISDNCDDNPSLDFTDNLEKSSVCGLAIIDRLFTATDFAGNFDTCHQEIRVRKPLQEEINLPTASVFLNCDDDFQVDENGHPHPNASGFPFIWTAYGIQSLTESYCNIVADYSDEIRVDICSGGYTIRREWTIINWCNIASTIIYNQFINVEDEQGPIIDFTSLTNGVQYYPDTLRFSTSAFDCTSNFQVPVPTITDNCSDSWSTKVDLVSIVEVPIIDFGVVVGTKIDTQILGSASGEILVLTEIPLGCHWLVYTVTDDCGNETIADYPVCIEDKVEPIVICENDITIALGGQGVGRLFASNVDEGSSDACGIQSIEIRRAFDYDENCESTETSFSPYGEFVDFGCCDAGKIIRVELKVTDEWGNFNTCWADVLVEDKIAPICEPPLSMSIKCVDLPGNFEPTDTLTLQSLFSVPTGQDNCEVVRFRELTPEVNLDDCGFGTILRKFEVYDKVGNKSNNQCTQEVTILPEYEYSIRFPKDTEVECGLPEPDTIFTNNIGCGLLGVRVNDERFAASQDECYKVFRTYQVINWCEYDELSQPIIISRDEDCDGKPGDEDVWVIRRPNEAFVDRDNDETNEVPLFGTKGTNCDGQSNPEGYWETINTTGFWQYTQLIVVYDRTPPSINYSEPTPFCSIDQDCTGKVEIPFSIDEVCNPSDLTFEVFLDLNRDTVVEERIQADAIVGGFPNYVINGTFPIGIHAFQINVTDGCGNIASFSLPFSIVDCKAPAFLCVASLTSPLMPIEGEQDVDGDGVEDRGMAVIKAESFIASVGSECTGDIFYSINRIGETPNPNQDSIILTCRDTAVTKLEVYAWDRANNPYSEQPDGTMGGPNYTFCEVFASVDDTELELCESVSGAISGIILTDDSRRVGGVEVRLSGEFSDQIMTEPNGVYSFESLPEGDDYTVAPFLDTDHNNGVSTFDIIIINKHILGVQPIESPYKLIAADANNSKSVSTIDIIRFRKLILGIDIRIEGNTSWRFIDSDYTFPIPSDPWFEEFPEAISINNLAGQLEEKNFIAIKVGDVNNSASVVADLQGETRSFEAPVNLISSIIPLQEELLKIELSLDKETEALQGFQFTLGFDDNVLDFNSVEYDLLEANNLGLSNLDRGLISVSWDQSSSSKRIDDSKILASFVFSHKQKTALIGGLSLNSMITKMEAYTVEGKVIPLRLIQANPTLESNEFVLGQNYPNPARDKTILPIVAPKEGKVLIEWFDINGKVIKQMDLMLDKGLNNIEVDCSNLPGGVLSYRVLHPTYKAYRKMIVLK